MKNIIAIFALVALFSFAGVTHGADCVNFPAQCQSNGSPEMVVNVWGTTNSQLPHILQGQTRNGFLCPAWFPFYCVDISGTQYFKDRWGTK